MNQFFRYSGLLLLMCSTASFAAEADGGDTQQPKGPRLFWQPLYGEILRA